MLQEISGVIKKAFILFLSAFIISNELIAQCTGCTAGKVPEMYVANEESIKRAKQFTKPAFLSASKYKRLSRIIGTEKLSLSYSKEAFDKLLNTISATTGYANLRVYIASVDPDYKQGIKHITDKTLIIIFAPASGDVKPKDLCTYYIIDEMNKIQPLDTATKNKWIAYYESKKMNTLKKTIKHYKREPENQIDKDYSDTKSICYSAKMIYEYFYCEPYYQMQLGDTINGIQVNFAAYTKKGDDRNGGMFKKRLHVLFEYTIDGKIFYIDENQGNFKKRIEITNAILQKSTGNRDAKFLGGDNGQLCPPTCP